jgi:hypothetical protein
LLNSCQLLKTACLSSTVFGTTEYSHFTVKFLSTLETSLFVIHSSWDCRVVSPHCLITVEGGDLQTD